MTASAPREWWRPEAGAATPAATVAHAAAPASPVEADSPVPFWALMVFTFIMLLAPQNYLPILSTIRAAFLVAGIAIGTYVYDRMRRAQPLSLRAPEIRCVGYLLVWAIVTIPFGSWPGGSVALLTDLYSKTLTIFLLIANTVNTVARLRIIVAGMTFMAAPIALTGVNNFLSGAYFGGDAAAARVMGYQSALTANPNDLALVLNLIIPLALGLALVTDRPLMRLLLLMSAGLQVVGVFITFSRAGFLSLATTVGLYIWTLARRPERGWAFATVILVVAALPFMPAKYMDRLSTITNIEADRTGSAQERASQQQAAVRYVMAHPIIGAGLGMNILAMNEAEGKAAWLNIHNVYLQYAADLGLPGLILFLAIFLGSIKSARVVQRRCAAAPEGRDLFYLATGIQASLISFAISAFFAPVAYHFQFYYIAGLAVAVKAVHDAAAPAPAGAARGPERRP